MLSRDIFKERKGVRGVIELFKSLNKDILKKKILKENIIEYIALQEDFCLSIDHIFFKQIIKKKIELGIKNIKIRINMEEEYLSYEDISDFETDKRKMFKDKNLEKYIKYKIKLINKCIKNLEFLLNNDIAISEFYNKIEDIENKYVSNKGNYMDDSFKDTENNDLKNFVINFLSKRVELINKIIEKNCKNIIKMDYLVFYRKPNNEDKFAFPLVELDKLENLTHLSLGIFYNDSEKELICNLPNELNKLKKLNSLKIKRLSYHGNINVNIKREIFDKLDVLKIKEVSWIIENNETFHFKNIKESHYKIKRFPEKYIAHKKYFFKEFLKGNVSWVKLDKLKIVTPFTNLEKDIIQNNDEYWINEEIIVFFCNAYLRDGYGYEKSTSEFFLYFFNFILNFQNIHIITKQPCKNVEEFTLKILIQLLKVIHIKEKI